MAIFDININAKIPTVYAPKSTSYIQGENCTGDIGNKAVGLYGNVSGTAMLVTNYTGPAPKTVYVKVTNYSDVGVMSLKKNGVVMTQGVEYTFDVTGYVQDGSITGFTFEWNQPADNTTVQSVVFDVAIEDINNFKYDYVSSNFKVFFGECLQAIQPSVSSTTSGPYNPCTGIYTAFSIIAQPNVPINFQYQTLSKGYSGYVGALDLLDAHDGNVIDNVIPQFVLGPNVIYNIIWNTNLTGTYHFRAFMCANPTPFPGVANTTSLELYLRNNDNTATIQTFPLTDSKN